VLLDQGVDNSFTVPFINPPITVGGPMTIPDPTKIASAHFTVLSPNYGSPALPTLTMGSGLTFALDGSGAACDVTATFTAAQMASLLGTLTQEKDGCNANINITANLTGGGTRSTTIRLRVSIMPNATSGA
jgi:hypothetical protein